MIVTIDTVAQTVTIKNLAYFGQLVDWEDYLDYEVIIVPKDEKTYLEQMNNPSVT